MASTVSVDFKIPKIGSKYSIIMNEGTSQALMGMLYHNPYEDEIERQAFDYGFQSGSYHKEQVMG